MESGLEREKARRSGPRSGASYVRPISLVTRSSLRQGLTRRPEVDTFALRGKRIVPSFDGHMTIYGGPTRYA